MALNKASNLHPVTKTFLPTQMVSAGVVNSQAIDMFNRDNPTVQFIWDGTLVGSFDVQGSVDYNPVTGLGDWDSIPLGSTPLATGSPNHGTIEINQFGPRWMRVVFTWSAGAGNLTGWIMGKGI